MVSEGTDVKSDSILGWLEEIEECFNSNLECKTGLICAPVDSDENLQMCLKPQTVEGSFCDDDEDCAGGDEVSEIIAADDRKFTLSSYRWQQDSFHKQNLHRLPFRTLVWNITACAMAL